MKKLIVAALVMISASAASAAEWVSVNTGRYATVYQAGSVKALGRGWYSGTYAMADRANDRLYVCSARFTREAYIDDYCYSKDGTEWRGEKQEIIPESVADALVQAMIKSVSY